MNLIHLPTLPFVLKKHLWKKEKTFVKWLDAILISETFIVQAKKKP